jgi:uncharacterized glyoxalase superfamily protein PhnB
MANKVKPIPEGYHTVTPYLIVKGAADAIDYYTKVFGATELFRMPRSRLEARRSCWPTRCRTWAS